MNLKFLLLIETKEFTPQKINIFITVKKESKIIRYPTNNILCWKTYQSGKEVMLLDFEGSRRAQPLQRVLMQQGRDDVLRLRRHRPVVLFRPLDVVVDGVREQLFRGFSEERNAADQELVENDAHAPPVHRFAVPLTEDDLGSNVLGGSKDLVKYKKISLNIFAATLTNYINF